MKLKKIISAVAAFAMMATVASAAVEFEYDEGYYIDNVADVAERTPSISTTVKQLTSAEVIALGNSNPTDISSKKLKNAETGYANTANYTVYEVTGTVNNVGALAVGYDRNDNTAAIKLMNITTSTKLTGIEYEAADVAATTDATTSVAWSGGVDPSTGVMLSMLQLGTDNAYPKAETAEGALVDTTYGFKQYYVLPAGHEAVTVSFDSASAGVSYLVTNGVEGYNNNMIEVKFAATSFVLAEAKATTDVVIDDVTEYTYSDEYDDNGVAKKYAGFTTSFTVGENNNEVVALNITGTKTKRVDLNTKVTSGTCNVMINILGVPADATLGTITVAPLAK